MAESGGQPGNQNATKGREWAAAIERALARKAGEVVEVISTSKGLDAAADKFVSLMDSQSEQVQLGFFREFGDRKDGKAKQQTELTGADGGQLLVRWTG